MTRNTYHTAIAQSVKFARQQKKAVEHVMTEAQLHRAVAAYLHKALKLPTVWTTFPAGGGGRVRGAQLKAMGLQAGWPDIIIIHPRGKTGIESQVCGLELKAKTGGLSPEQKAFRIVFEEANGWYAMCKSLDDVEEALTRFGIPLHASVLRRKVIP